VRRHLLTLLLLAFAVSPVWATDQSFNTSMRVFRPIVVNKGQDLTFPTQVLNNGDTTLVVKPSDTEAAVFNTHGGENRTMIRSVLESNIMLTAPDSSDSIIVNGFTVAGPESFNSAGQANNIRVGATAKLLASVSDGDYYGVGTLRVIYQ